MPNIEDLISVVWQVDVDDFAGDRHQIAGDAYFRNVIYDSKHKTCFCFVGISSKLGMFQFRIEEDTMRISRVVLVCLMIGGCGAQTSEDKQVPETTNNENETSRKSIEQPQQKPPPKAIVVNTKAFHQPTRSWIGQGCKKTSTRSLIHDDLVVKAAGNVELSVGRDGGLLAYRESRTAIRLLSMDRKGSLGASAKFEPNKFKRIEKGKGLIGLARIGSEFLLTTRERCPDDVRYTCLLGRKISSSGEIVGEVASTRVGAGSNGDGSSVEELNPLPLQNAAEATLWMLAQEGTGKDSWFHGIALHLEDDKPAFSTNIYGVPTSSGYPGNYVKSALTFADNSTLGIFYSYEFDTDRGTVRGRQVVVGDSRFNPKVTGTLRDFVVVDGTAHALMQKKSGFEAVKLSKDAQTKKEVSSEGPLPAPFDERVLLPSDRHSKKLRFRDPLNNTIGDILEFNHPRKATTFTGDEFLVVTANKKQELALTTVTCGL